MGYTVAVSQAGQCLDARPGLTCNVAMCTCVGWLIGTTLAEMAGAWRKRVPGVRSPSWPRRGNRHPRYMNEHHGAAALGVGLSTVCICHAIHGWTTMSQGYSQFQAGVVSLHRIRGDWTRMNWTNVSWSFSEPQDRGVRLRRCFERIKCLSPAVLSITPCSTYLHTYVSICATRPGCSVRPGRSRRASRCLCLLFSPAWRKSFSFRYVFKYAGCVARMYRMQIRNNSTSEAVHT